MAICLITNNPAETAEQYERVMSHLADSGPVPPEGARLLIAGPGADGLRAVSVWDSPQALERFWGERLAPAYQAAGVVAENTIRQVFDVHTLITRDPA